MPGGLRFRISTAIALIVTLALSLSLLVSYLGTAARLRDRIDADLVTQEVEWRQLVADADLSDPRSVESAATRFIDSQRYHPAARVFAVDVAGGTPVTNQPRLLHCDDEDEHTRDDADNEHKEEYKHGIKRGCSSPSSGSGMIDARPGMTTTTVDDIGRLRVLTRPIQSGADRVGTLQIAEPLISVEEAQSSLLRTFVLAGTLALLLSILAGVGIATLIARPLRRITRTAVAIDAGDLSRRSGATSVRGEAGVLAVAFDRMLDRIERAFSRQRDFVSDASHELRTPLAVLRAQVELLDREHDEHRRRQATATLLRRLDEIDRLVGDMLTLTSADAGRLVEPHQIDLGDFLEDLRRDLPLFGERHFTLTPMTGTLNADPDRLTQVLRNLVRNAVMHTDVDGHIEVAVAPCEDTLVFSVSDDGPGIEPEHIPHIFERFYRADHSRSRDSGGSGLGLAIARAIVEAHGGRIWVDSAQGQGATFSFQMPGFRPTHDDDRLGAQGA